MDTASVDEQSVDELVSMINDKPGETQVYLEVHDSETNHPLMLRSRAKKVKLDKSLIDFLSQSLVFNYKLNW